MTTVMSHVSQVESTFWDYKSFTHVYCRLRPMKKVAGANRMSTQNISLR